MLPWTPFDKPCWMMQTTLFVDTKKFTTAINLMLMQSKRTMHEVVTEQMRGIIKRTILVTPPSNGTENPGTALQIGQRTIESDLRRIFTPVSNELLASQRDLFGTSVMSDYGHKGAKSIGQTETRILTRGDMPAWHRQRRTANGRVMNVRRDVTTGHRKRDLRGLDTGLVSKADFASYLESQQKRVGMLAAGWLKAASALGVRGIPAWITRHSSMPGAITIKATDTVIEITATNRVPFAGNVRDLTRRCQWAVDRQAEAMMRRIESAVRSMAARAGF